MLIALSNTIISNPLSARVIYCFRLWVFSLLRNFIFRAGAVFRPRTSGFHCKGDDESMFSRCGSYLVGASSPILIPSDSFIVFPLGTDGSRRYLGVIYLLTTGSSDSHHSCKPLPQILVIGRSVFISMRLGLWVAGWVPRLPTEHHPNREFMSLVGFTPLIARCPLGGQW
jgi:hypothetical protein